MAIAFPVIFMMTSRAVGLYMHITCCSTEILKHTKILLYLIDPVTAFISFDGEEDEKEEEESSLKVQSHSHRVWENEFVPVARSLLNRIHQHHTSLVPL